MKILVVDDDPKVSWILSEGLSDAFDFAAARNGAEALQMITTEKPNLILLDIKMPDMSGIEVLKKLSKADPRPEVIMLSGHDDTHYVVESIQNGAAEFIKKPFDVKEVEIHINSILERSRLKREVSNLKTELRARSQYDAFVGDSHKIIQVKNLDRTGGRLRADGVDSGRIGNRQGNRCPDDSQYIAPERGVVHQGQLRRDPP